MQACVQNAVMVHMPLFHFVQAYLEAMTRMFGACTQRTIDKFSAATEGGKVSFDLRLLRYLCRGHVVPNQFAVASEVISCCSRCHSSRDMVHRR
jgi:hypothetical protein